MTDGLTRAIGEFRKYKRSVKIYGIFKMLHVKLASIVNIAAPDASDGIALFEDLENVAVCNAVKNFSWLEQQPYLWERSKRERIAHIRHDALLRLDQITHGSKPLKEFLINLELLNLVNLYDRNEETFWKEVEERMNEYSMGKHA